MTNSGINTAILWLTSLLVLLVVMELGAVLAFIFDIVSVAVTGNLLQLITHLIWGFAAVYLFLLFLSISKKVILSWWAVTILAIMVFCCFATLSYFLFLVAVNNSFVRILLRAIPLFVYLPLLNNLLARKVKS